MTEAWFTDPFPNTHIYNEPEPVDPYLRMSIPNSNEENRYSRSVQGSGNANTFHFEQPPASRRLDTASIQRILRQAGHRELIRSGNETYTQLYESNMHLISEQNAKITLIRELRGVIQDLSSTRAVKHKQETYMDRRDLPRPFPLDIPLSPTELDQADYPDVKYWTLEEWNQYSNNANGETNLSKLGFLCNEDGDPVNKARLRVMTDMAKKLWSDLFRYRFDPVTWRYVGKAADEYFSNNMRVSFPEFTLCAESWKVKMFATIRYPDWSTGSRGTGRLSRAVPSIKNNGYGLSVGPSKRVQEDDKENERDGTVDKRPRLLESVTATTDSTHAITSNNPKRVSTSKRPRPQSHFKAQSKANVENTNLTPPTPSLAPVVSIDTPSTVQTISVTTATRTLSINTVSTPFAQVPTKTATSVAPNSAQAPLTSTSIPTTSTQTLDIQMQDPSSDVSADVSTMALPAPIAATSGPTQELDAEKSQGASMSSVPVGSGMEFLAAGELEEMDGPPRTGDPNHDSASLTSNDNSYPLPGPARRTTRNPLENLDIPQPAEQIQHKPASSEELAKANLKNRKSTQKPVPKPTSAMTAPNLFLTEFRNEHGDDASADDFSKAWKAIDKAKLKEYENRAKAMKVAAKAATTTAAVS